MSKIVIGKAGHANATLALDILLRTHLLIWASTGGGKSYLIRRIVEQACKKIPIIIVDREGEFATLRDKFDFVLVGPGGETPADPRSAKLVAEKLLELGASAVCDLFEMKVETRHEWVKNFYEALVNAPKRLWSPAIIILDEAHSFAPEKGQGESPAYGAVTDFSGVARKRGFGSIFATQRLSKLSKNATAEMYNQAAGPTASQADRDRAAYEMGISGKANVTEFSDTLRTLEPGNFFFQGRAISIDRILVKVGPAETAHEAGKHLSGHVPKAPPTPENIKALLPKLADLPKAAEEQARTVAEFKKEIASLKAQLRAQPKQVPQKVAVFDTKQIDRAVAATARSFEKQLAESNAFLKRLQNFITKIAGDCVKLSQEITQYGLTKSNIHIPKIPGAEIQKGEVHSHSRVVPERGTPAIPHHSRPDVSTNGNSELPEGESKVLNAIAQYDEGADRDQLSVLTGYKRSTRNTYLSRLMARGLIGVSSGRLIVTQAGRDALGSSYQPLPTGRELQDYWLRELPEGESRILELLIKEGGELDRDSIEELTGFKRSTRNTYISRLIARRVIEDAGGGRIKITEMMRE